MKFVAYNSLCWREINKFFFLIKILQDEYEKINPNDS